VNLLRSAAVGTTVAVSGAVLAIAPRADALAPADVPVRAAAAVSAVAPCSTKPNQPVPKVHRLGDTPEVTASDLAAVPEVAAPAPTPAPATVSPLLRRAVSDKVGGVHLPKHVKIPVYVHVIRGVHRTERHTAGPRQVRRMIKVLNKGFHGGESKANTPTRYTFKLRHIDYHKRDGWYHTYLFRPLDKQMRRTLHRGGKRALNIYINGGGPIGQPVLGWTTFPWKQHKHPLLDGVGVNWRAMPWGTLKHYHQGDTIIHETGHWLGLFHTFQGGCKAPGDKVADTPSERYPSYRCNTKADTCKGKPGLDPVHNFMDYSWDSCMNQFTPDQVARMDRSFVKYRR